MRRLDRTAMYWLAAWTALAACTLDNGAQDTNQVVLDTGESAGDTSTTAVPGHSSTTTGDPDGTSTTAADTSSGDPGAESSSSSGLPDACGDGVLDPGEACDGQVPGDCASLDPLYTGGTPTCSPDCQLDLGPCEACEAPELLPCDDASTDALHALELGCDTVRGHDPAKSAPLLARTLSSPDPDAYRVLRRFGSHPDAWVPRRGTRALLLSTGAFPKLGPGEVQLMSAGAAQLGPLSNNNNPNSPLVLPEATHIRPDKGAPKQPFVNCDGVNDCSNTLNDQWKPSANAFDLLSIVFEVQVPPGTHGFSLDLAFFSAHFPEHNLSTYNDMAVVWAQSEAYVGNVTYLHRANGLGPLAVPDLVLADWMRFDGAVDLELANTGFDAAKDVPNSHGGASGWLTAEGPATPGETLTVAIAVFDLGDSFNDTALMLDNWRWRCAPCDLATTCGLRPAD